MATSAPTETYEFTKVVDKTGSEYYRVTGAHGETRHMYGSAFSTLTLDIKVLKANGITVRPQAVIRWADGTTTKCEDTDERRQPGLSEETTSWDRPCPSLQDPTGAVVTVTDTSY